MLGRDHAASGSLAFLAAAPLLHIHGLGLAAGAVFTAGAALVPDIDEGHSTIARQGGYVTRGLAFGLHAAGVKHRTLTHSAVGTAVFAAGAWVAVYFDHTIAGRVILGLMIWLLLAAAMHALRIGPLRIGGHHGDTIAAGAAAAAVWFGAGLRWVPLCVLLGSVAHIAGDMLTHHGCPIGFPFSREDCWLLPEDMRFTTGGGVEWVVTGLLVAGIALLAWRDTAHASILHTHLAGYVGR